MCPHSVPTLVGLQFTGRIVLLLVCFGLLVIIYHKLLRTVKFYYGTTITTTEVDTLGLMLINIDFLKYFSSLISSVEKEIFWGGE